MRNRSHSPATAIPALAFILAGLLSGCQDPADIHHFDYEVMGTVAKGEIYVRDKSGKQSPVHMVQATFDSVNAQLSCWSEASEVGLFNAAPAGSTYAISKWLSTCLRVSESLRDVSGGAFDPTAGPLMHLWGFHRRQGHLPSEAELDSTLALLGGYEHDPSQRTVKKTNDNTRFDLGAIAKGFAVDRAVANLIASGTSSALIDLGGNIFALGRPDGRDTWRLGIRDPLDKDHIVATFSLINQAVATSGSYERFVEIDGRRYGHIMNPATGRPAEGLLSATVICRSAMLADGLSTTLFVLGPDEAVRLLREHYLHVDAVLILPGEGTAKARVLATAGLEGNIRLSPEYRGRYSLEFLRF